jgi:acyl-CoA thioester hydrolase
MKNSAARLALESYPFTVQIETRFSDLDYQRHINNVAVANFYQEARLQFHRQLWPDAQRPQDTQTLIARHGMDYLKEIHYPGSIIVGLAVADIGRTSYTLASAMFQSQQCVGVAHTVLVFAQDSRPAPLPEPMRERLAQLCIAAGALD